MTSTRFSKLRDPTQPLLARAQDAIDATLRPVATALAKTPIMGAKPPPWLLLTVATGWGSTVAGSAVPSFHKDALGYVHGKGATTNTTGGPLLSAIGTFPLGYRPKDTILVAVAGGVGLSQQYLGITPAGIIAPGTAVAAADWIGFSFSFLAEQ